MVQVPHYNYVGDAVLGFKAHMGAGAITANIKADKSNVIIRGGLNIDTGLRKMGAVLGDFADVGCNSVLTPGVIIGRGTNLYPLSMVRGVVPANSVYKSGGKIAKRTEIYFSFKKHLHNPWRRGIFILPLHGFFVGFFATEIFRSKRMGIFAEKIRNLKVKREDIFRRETACQSRKSDNKNSESGGAIK